MIAPSPPCRAPSCLPPYEMIEKILPLRPKNNSSASALSGLAALR